MRRSLRRGFAPRIRQTRQRPAGTGCRTRGITIYPQDNAQDRKRRIHAARKGNTERAIRQSRGITHNARAHGLLRRRPGLGYFRTNLRVLPSESTSIFKPGLGVSRLIPCKS